MYRSCLFEPVHTLYSGTKRVELTDYSAKGSQPRDQLHLERDPITGWQREKVGRRIKPEGGSKALRPERHAQPTARSPMLGLMMLSLW